jgi:hypothetical protein
MMLSPRLRQRRDDPLDMVHHLVSVIGPRQPTSLGEARAAAYVDSRLRRAGLSVNADTFRAARSSGLTYFLLALLGVGAVLLAFWLPLWALLLALYGLLLAVSDALVIPLPALAQRRDSQNIVAIRACEGTEEGTPPWPRWRLVLLAPLDTPPERPGPFYLAGRHVGALVGRIGAFVGLVLLLGLQVFDPRDVWRYGQMALAAYLLLSALPLPWRGHQSALLGSAGALAVLLSAVERLGALRSVEVWAVAVGASSTDAAGLQNLLLRYPFARENTLFLSLQQIGDSHLIAATREGVLRQHRADDLLLHLVHEAAATDPEATPAVVRPWANASSLASVLHSRNYRVLSMLSRDRQSIAPPESDAPDTAHAAALEQAARLVAGVAQQLDLLEQASDNAKHGQSATGTAR